MITQENQTLDLFAKARDLIVEGKDLDTAEEMLHELLNANMDSPEILFTIAGLHMKRSNYGLASSLFKYLTTVKENFVEAYNNIGYIAKQYNHQDEARRYFEKAISLIPGYTPEEAPIVAEYYCNLGSTYVGMGTSNEALKWLDKALEMDPNCSQAKWNAALAYLELGEYDKGFKWYDDGDRTTRCKYRNYTQDETPFWDGTPGKTVVVYGEQGIGDELMFASVLPDLMKDCDVILDAHPRLADIFRQSFPNIPIYGTRKTSKLCWPAHHKVDSKIAIGSLGQFYRNTKEAFPGTPYLKADPKLISNYRGKLDSLSGRKKIGLSWRGGTIQTNTNARRIAMESLLPLFELDADFISLQYNTEADVEVKEFNEKYSQNLHHWPEMLADYDETAGLLCNMDLIISVPQSVVHLAGSLGINTIQLCPKRALWQMGPYGQDMPWYSSVRNIWQDDDGDWAPVIQKAKEELCSLLQINTVS